MFYVTIMQECQQLNLNPTQFLPDLIFIIFPLLATCLPVIKMFQSKGKSSSNGDRYIRDFSSGIFQTRISHIHKLNVRSGSCLCAHKLTVKHSFFWIIHDSPLAQQQFVIQCDTVEDHYAGLRS